MNKFISFLYKLARHLNDIKALLPGKPGKTGNGLYNKQEMSLWSL